jgi:hypothetical protein
MPQAAKADIYIKPVKNAVFTNDLHEKRHKSLILNGTCTSDSLLIFVVALVVNSSLFLFLTLLALCSVCFPGHPLGLQ